MKFCISKRYNVKTWGVLSNQQLKKHTQVKNRESSNFVFLFSQLCKNEHSLFFPWGPSITLCCASLAQAIYYTNKQDNTILAA